MIFGFGKKKKDSRHVVATVLVAVDGDAFVPAIVKVTRAAQRLAADDGRGVDTFAGASQALADTARLLLDHETHWDQAALGGDVFDSEDHASAQVAEVYADLSGRYSSSPTDNDLDKAAGDDTSRERRAVVMLTACYQGEDADVERELNDRLDLARVLRGLIALHERDALLAAHIHVAPAHIDDRLTDEQLLMLFPELNTL